MPNLCESPPRPRPLQPLPPPPPLLLAAAATTSATAATTTTTAVAPALAIPLAPRAAPRDFRRTSRFSLFGRPWRFPSHLPLHLATPVPPRAFPCSGAGTQKKYGMNKVVVQSSGTSRHAKRFSLQGVEKCSRVNQNRTGLYRYQTRPDWSIPRKPTSNGH